MYKHSGKKLKAVAYVLAGLGAVISVALALALVMTRDAAIPGVTLGASTRLVLAVAVFVLGLFLSWVCGLAVFGYGELIEKSKESEYMLTRIAAHSKEIIEYISRDNKADD